VRIHPHDPYNHFNLGIIFCQDRQFEQGVVHFNDAIQRDPDFLPALISLSLIRSASPVDALRNGPQAVELATRACELSRYENPMALHALAAAYAEVGRFPDALATVEVALRITRGAAQEAFAKELQRMLGLLQQQKPYRSSPR
jgi:tetratricopeptide (TPR) repeat protein